MPDPVTIGVAGGAGALAGLGGSLLSSSASRKASRAQAEAIRYAADVQRDIAKKTISYLEGTETRARADVAPWREAGVRALGTLEELMAEGPGEFKESPGYQFRLAEGVKALERGAASRGRLFSGGQAKALTQYGQDYATSDYDNFLRRYYQKLQPYQSLAGAGETAATNLANIGMQTGSNVAGTMRQTGQSLADLAVAEGQARASGYINQANAWNNLLGQAGSTGLSLAAYNG